jgi:hypothetical protein
MSNESTRRILEGIAVTIGATLVLGFLTYLATKQISLSLIGVGVVATISGVAILWKKTRLGDESISRSTLALALLLTMLGAGLAGGIVGAYVNQRWTFTPDQGTAPQTTSQPSKVPSTETRIPYQASFGESVIDGVMVWPETGSVRSAGVFKLKGTQAAEPCAVKVRFETKDSNNLLLGSPQEKHCNLDPANWPKYGPASLEGGTRISHVDIIIVVNDQEVLRIVCPRLGACHT